MASKSCARCQRTVYPIEELKCLDKVWHKTCFKCHECGMILNMKTYKGFNKLPYCNAHCPQARATTVAETPESRRLAKNTTIQSNVKYHADFEKQKGKLTQVADDPETLRITNTTKIISNALYHGEYEKKKQMEERRTLIGDDSNAYNNNNINAAVFHQYSSSLSSTNNNNNNNNNSAPPLTHMKISQQSQHQPQYVKTPIANATNNFNNNHNQRLPTQQQAAIYHQQNINNNNLNQNDLNNKNYYGNTNNNSKLPTGNITKVSQTGYYVQQQQPDNVARGGYGGQLQQIYNQQQSYSPKQMMVQSTPAAAVAAQHHQIPPQYIHQQQSPNHKTQYQQQQQQPQQPPQMVQMYPGSNYNPLPQYRMVQPQQISPQKSSIREANLGLCFRAIYDYTAQDFDEVTFVDGDLIINCQPIDSGWMKGTVQRTGQTGMLPSNYVEAVN